RGEQPTLGDYLPADQPLRRAVLVELLLTDAEYRGKAGKWSSLESGLEQFPELAGDESLVQQLRASWPVPDPTSEPLSAQATDRGASPRRLGRFELLEVVGSGSFSTVYRARDPELGRMVAVKVPRLGGEVRPEDCQRFLREARSAARLCHSGIVPVHDVG